MSLPYTIETFPSREAWLKGRTKGIGASDAGAILGWSKWSSPFAIWAKKRGIIPEDTRPDELREWGWLMEPTIAAWLAKSTGWTIRRDDNPVICRSKQWDWLCCTLDAWAIPSFAGIELGGRTITEPFSVELKNTDAHVAHEWKKAPPQIHQAQAQCQMAVLGTPVVVIAVCIGGNEGRWFPVFRDERAIGRIVYQLQQFWNRVREGRPPEVDGHDETRKALAAIHAQPMKGRRIECPRDQMGWVTQFDACTKIAAKAEEGRDIAANHIRQLMADAEELSLPGMPGGFTWRKATDGTRSLRRTEKLPKLQTQEDYSEYEPAEQAS